MLLKPVLEMEAGYPRIPETWYGGYGWTRTTDPGIMSAVL